MGRRAHRTRSDTVMAVLVDWEQVLWRLRAAAGADLDDEIDALATSALTTPMPEATAVLIEALAQARSWLSQRSAAIALAACAGADDRDAVNALVAAYQDADNSFVRMTAFEALGYLGRRSNFARAHATAIALGLSCGDDRYLLIAAARTLGSFNLLRSDPSLREKLRELVGTEDPAVHAEAWQQLGLTDLGEALLAANGETLRQMLVPVRATFARAAVSDELRPDASVFVWLLDLLLGFFDLSTHPQEAAAMAASATAEIEVLAAGRDLAWPDYRSGAAAMLFARVRRVAVSLQRAAMRAACADDWTDFDNALGELASIYAVVRWGLGSGGPGDTPELPLASLADVAYAPSLGPLLTRAVTSRRLNRVIERYIERNGEDEQIAGLRALRDARDIHDFANTSSLPAEIVSRLTRMAKLVDRTPGELLDGWLASLERGEGESFIAALGISVERFPGEQAQPYGHDPNVDDVVRQVLCEIWSRLSPYPQPRWERIIQTTVEIVQFVQRARDTLPDYLLCTEDRGLGQTAKESELQRPLYDWLRQRFNRFVSYEQSHEGGGRPDVFLRFPECEVAIDAKREFTSVKRHHVHDNYLAQSDVHASGSDRFSVVLVMDLRSVNAVGHLKTRRRARKDGSEAKPVSLYSLDESFWVDALEPDPQVTGARGNAVLVGLVPGNRTKPSGTTDYSRPPARTPRRQ